jgi:hypothetical protein
MKPFNLEDAKRGEPIVCRDGTPAKFIAHVPEANDGRRLIVLISNFIFTHFENGREYPSDTDRDLFMAPKKRTVWVNFYANGGALHFDSEMNADTNHLYVRESAYHHNYPRIGNRAYPVEIEE